MKKKHAIKQFNSTVEIKLEYTPKAMEVKYKEKAPSDPQSMGVQFAKKILGDIDNQLRLK